MLPTYLNLPEIDVRALVSMAGIALALWGMIILLPLHPARTPVSIQQAKIPVKRTAIKTAIAPAALPARRNGPLSAQEQWQKISGVMAVATDSAASVRNLQKSAASHLDSANYALQELMFELEAVMPSYRTTPTTLRRIVPAAAPQPEPRLALAA